VEKRLTGKGYRRVDVKAVEGLDRLDYGVKRVAMAVVAMAVEVCVQPGREHRVFGARSLDSGERLLNNSKGGAVCELMPALKPLVE